MTNHLTIYEGKGLHFFTSTIALHKNSRLLKFLWRKRLCKPCLSQTQWNRKRRRRRHIQPITSTYLFMLSRGGATAWSVVEPLLLGGDHVEGGDWSGDGDEMASTLLWSREPRSCQPQHQPGPGRCHWSGLRIDWWWWWWQCV